SLIDKRVIWRPALVQRQRITEARGQITAREAFDPDCRPSFPLRSSIRPRCLDDVVVLASARPPLAAILRYAIARCATVHESVHRPSRHIAGATSVATGA